MRPTRRDILTSAIALSIAPLHAGARQTPRAPAAAPSPEGFDPWVEVNAANLAHNVREVARVAQGQPILAVVKNNGYGMGVTTVARLLEPEAAVAGFAVVKLDEAHALRDAGIRKPVLLMGPLHESALADVHKRGITPMVYTAVGSALERAAAAVGLHARSTSRWTPVSGGSAFPTPRPSR